MQIPVYSRYLFIDQNVFNTAQALLYGNWSTHNNYFNNPGVANGSSITIGTTGLVVGLTCASPVGVQFSSGVFAQGLGTTNGATSSFYSTNLSGSVPASGSQTVYLVAQTATISGASNLIVGPPPGHPDYDPTFTPATVYTQQYDSFSVSGTLVAPNNTSVIELARVTLTAGQATIAASSVITTYQQAAASYVPEITYPVLMTATQGGTAAINSPALTWQSWTGSTSAQMQMFLSSGTYLGGPSAPSLIFQTPGASAAFINFNSQSANISLWAPATGAAASSPTLAFDSWTGSAHLAQGLLVDSSGTLHIESIPGSDTLQLTNGGALTLPAAGATSAVSGNLLVGGTLTSNGAATFNSLNVVNNTILSGTLNVSGVATFASTLFSSGAATFNSLNVVNNTILSGTLNVSGVATFAGTLNASGNSTIGGALTVIGQATINSNVLLTSNTVQLQTATASAFPTVTVRTTGVGAAPSFSLSTATPPTTANPDILLRLNTATQLLGFWYTGSSAANYLVSNYNSGAPTLASFKNTLDDGTGAATFAGLGTFNAAITAKKTTSAADANSAGTFARADASYGMNFYPQLSAGSFNSLVQVNDSGLIASGAGVGTGVLALTIWSATKAGLRLTANGTVTTANSTLDDGSGNATFIGTLAVGTNTAGAPTISINGAAATYRQMLLETAGVTRWALFADNGAESGSNAGSNFGLNAYSDAGSYLSTPLRITRATGALHSLFSTLDDGSGNAAIAGQATVDTNVVLNTGTIALTNSATSVFPNIVCRTTGSGSQPSFILGTASSPTTANPDLYSRLTAGTTLSCFWYNGSSNVNYLSSLYNSGSPTLSSFKNTLDDGNGNLTAAGFVKGSGFYGFTSVNGAPLSNNRFTANNQTKATGAVNIVFAIGNAGAFTGCTEQLPAPTASGDTVMYLNGGGWSTSFTFSGNGNNIYFQGATVASITSNAYSSNYALLFTWNAANSIWILMRF